ncbi:MAG: PD40 domain-containing protein, partial [Nitrospirae bacterium]|nr:PD40 domain-containing protein [Nitrospirota bacterium]
AFWKGVGDERRAAESAFLDRACHEDYARILLPRTIAYTAGLIRYFFRGELALIPNGPGKFRVKNLSEEPLTGGRLELYADPPDGERLPVAALDLPLSAVLMPGDLSPPITVRFPEGSSVPSAYRVVYRGRLGEEEGAVIGAAAREILVFATNRRGTEELFTMGTEGGGAAPLVENQDPMVTFGRPVLSPDGTQLAYHSRREGEDGIYLRNLRTGEERRVGRGYWPSWSPDGRTVAFQRFTDGEKHDLFTVDVETGWETRLTDDPHDNLYPAWSPDGSRVAYTSGREGRYQIVVKDLWGAVPEAVVTGGSRAAFKPAWSPDGFKIAFERPDRYFYPGGDPVWINIHVVDLRNGEEVNLTRLETSGRTASAWAGSPAWSPDGREIAVEFWETETTGSDLWTLDAETGAFLRNLTAGSLWDDGYPAFGMGGV